MGKDLHLTCKLCVLGYTSRYKTRSPAPFVCVTGLSASTYSATIIKAPNACLLGAINLLIHMSVQIYLAYKDKIHLVHPLLNSHFQIIIRTNK